MSIFMLFDSFQISVAQTHQMKELIQTQFQFLKNGLSSRIKSKFIKRIRTIQTIFFLTKLINGSKD